MPDVVETVDAPADTSTSYNLAVGQSSHGEINVGGDHDWFRVDLIGGETYTFSLTGTGSNNVQDTYLRIYGPGGGTLVASDDDGLPGLNSVLTYTAATSGTYYIDAAAYGAGEAGRTYGVTATAGTRVSLKVQMGAGVIDTDYSWTATPGTGADVTYAFRLTDSGDEPNFGQLTSAQINSVASILSMYEDVCGLTFSRVNQTGYSDDATMLFSNYSAYDGAGAYAYYPGATTSASRNGDVYLNTTSVSTISLPTGGYSHFAIMHEIGHAVGLSHPGLYNAGVGITITYDNDAQFTQDTHQYTVMSYFDESHTTVSYGSYPDTLMLYDIYALQQIYGANMATRNGDSVYGYNSNVGGIYDFSGNTTPALCIWDGGGTDTLDCSGYSGDQDISLVAGTFSNIRGFVGNVSIAVGAMIEKAIGGAGGDTIYGNEAENVLIGNAGNDTLDGGAGRDRLYGGDGDDTINWDANDYWTEVLGGNGTDTLVVRNAALPSSFNLTLHDFEQASLSVNDISNDQAWNFYAQSYDTLWRLTGETGEYDNGSTWASVFDAQNIESYYYYRDELDSLGRLTHQTLTRDDNSYSTSTFDAANVYPWFRDDRYHDTAGRLTYGELHRDDDTWSRSSYDVGNAHSWLKADDYFNSANQMIFQELHRDDHSWSRSTYDVDNGHSWLRTDDYLNSVGQIILQELHRDDNSWSRSIYDVGNAYNWSRTDDYFNANGQVITQEIHRDDNSWSQSIYDVANRHAWSIYNRVLDADNNVIFYYGTYDDGSLF